MNLFVFCLPKPLHFMFVLGMFTLGIGASIASAVVAQGPPLETGVPGTDSPQSVDVRLPDTLVNQDTRGGTNQVLLSLAASPGAGFAAVWRDQRDGMLGLYLGRTNALGELLEPERPIHEPHSRRRVDPAVALGKDNSGAVVWVSLAGNTNVPWVRTFDSSGKWLCTDRPLVPLEAAANTHPGREVGSRLPVVVALPYGGYAVAWTQSGQVKYQELEHDGAPHGKTIRLAPSSPPAEAGVHLAVSHRGSVLCMWRTKAGNMAINHGRSDTAPVNSGMGVLCRLITDPVGGFWGGFLIEGQVVLRHLSVDGKPDRPDVKPIAAAVTGLDLALGDDSIALLVETANVPRAELRGERGGAGATNAGTARGAGSDRKSKGDPAPGGDHPASGDPSTSGEPAAGGDSGKVGEPSKGGETGKSGDPSAGGDRAASGEPSAGGEQAAGGEPSDGGERKEKSGRAAGGDDAASGESKPVGDGSTNSFVVYVLDREGRATNSPPARIAMPAAVSVNGPRIVSNGKRSFVAWTDSRNGDQDVYGRVFEPSATRSTSAVDSDPRLGVERRVNTDVASSDQTTPRLAAWGRRAVIAWQDGRDRVNRVYARLIGPSGFTSDEFPLPAPVGDAAPVLTTSIHPEVAVRADGEFAVQWKGPSGKTGGLHTQCFHADKTPVGVPVIVDEGQGFPSHAIVALGEDRGYTIAWIRSNKGGVWARRMMPDGKLTTAVRVAEEQDGELGDLALTLLDDQRLILVWDVHAAGDAWSLRARFIDSEGTTKSDELTFDPTPRKIDWQPCVAPAANNGFVMGWCSGSPGDASHDVYARVFDAHGKPTGPFLPISFLDNEQDYAQIVRLPDKTYVITWEDDISYHDHTYLRRILPNARELGPIVRMNEPGSKAVEGRTGPQLAVLGDGLVGAWNDRRRSLGWDIFMRILGPKFDDVKKR